MRITFDKRWCEEENEQRNRWKCPNLKCMYVCMYVRMHEYICAHMVQLEFWPWSGIGGDSSCSWWKGWWESRPPGPERWALSAFLHTYIHMHACKWLYVCMYVCMYVGMYSCSRFLLSQTCFCCCGWIAKLLEEPWQLSTSCDATTPAYQILGSTNTGNRDELLSSQPPSSHIASMARVIACIA